MTFNDNAVKIKLTNDDKVVKKRKEEYRMVISKEKKIDTALELEELRIYDNALYQKIKQLILNAKELKDIKENFKS